MSYGTTLLNTSLRQKLNDLENRLAAREGLTTGWLIFFFLLSLVLIVSRSPILFTRAQFYAEDGAVWFADAYNTGWLHSLTLPDGGYLNTLQRLGAGPSLLVPFRNAPLVMVLIGLFVQAIPVPILFSSRCRDWASLPLRIFFAAIYIAIPNSSEIQVVLTNSQWHLAVAAGLLAFASAPRGWGGRLADFAIILVAGFSGPFCIVLLPLVVLFWWVKRQSWSATLLAMMSVGTLTQVILLLKHHGDRVQDPLGATARLFTQMLGGNIILSGVLGSHLWSRWVPVSALAAVILYGMGLYLYCLWHSPLGLKLFLIFCFVLLPAELKTPLIAGPKPLWELLVTDAQGRYWFFPMIAILWSATWCAGKAPSRPFSWAGALVLIALPVGIVSDWRFDAPQDVQFNRSVEQFEAARGGEHVTMPVVPSSIVMTVIKK